MRDVGTLLEALPYIREFHGKTVVIKYGGAAMEDAALREEFARDVVLLKYVGLNPIVVHGGGPEITPTWSASACRSSSSAACACPTRTRSRSPRWCSSARSTRRSCCACSRHGQPAVGLCGDDGSLFRVARRTAPGGEDIGFVGRIERVNVGVIEHVASDYIPVIASVGADREGHSYNVNADEAAGAVARRARRLQGRLPHRRRRLAGATRPTPTSLISQAGAEQVRAALRASTAACAPSSRPASRRSTAGVSAAHILDGRVAALAAARAVHRRRHRHQDRGRPVTLDELQAARARARDRLLRAPAGRVRARGGRAAVGRRRQRVPRLPVRHLGHEPRPLPPARSSRPCASRPAG